MATIHPSAVVAAGAEIGDDVEIGPYCVIGSHVKLGAGTRLHSHVVVDGSTTIGAGCTLFPFASIGTLTQDLKYKGGAPRVEIGDGTTLREYVTVNAATYDGDATRVGSRCHIMAYAHIAHDCIVGDEVIIANCGTLAGHVIIEDQAILGGLSGIHQFVRIGRMSIIGGCSKVTQDVPPFMMADGHPLEVRGINRVALERRQVERSVQSAIKECYRFLYRKSLTTSQALEQIRAEISSSPEVDQLVAFIEASERGIAR